MKAGGLSTLLKIRQKDFFFFWWSRNTRSFHPSFGFPQGFIKLKFVRKLVRIRHKIKIRQKNFWWSRNIRSFHPNFGFPQGFMRFHLAFQRSSGDLEIFGHFTNFMCFLKFPKRESIVFHPYSASLPTCGSPFRVLRPRGAHQFSVCMCCTPVLGV